MPRGTPLAPPRPIASHPTRGTGAEATIEGGPNTSTGAFGVPIRAAAIHSHSTAEGGPGAEIIPVSGWPMGRGCMALNGIGPTSSPEKSTPTASTISYVSNSLEMG
jgi:hypothetical protein